jgi:Domain of unknown function (DUF4249)
MKKIFYIIITSFLVFSCTEVVDIPLDTDSPRLVIEASINWQKGTDGKNQKIKLTTTTNFYTNTIPVVSDAIVIVKNSANTQFDFIETPNTGIYVCNNFVPVLNETYTLTIVSKGKTYNATEILKPVAPITTITQETIQGFGGEVVTIKTNYLDPAETEDFYLFNYKIKDGKKPDFYVSDDKFYNGNEFFSNVFDDELKATNQITVTHTGISKEYYEYLNILLNLAGNQGGGPFQAPPVTVRGNILNTTNLEDFPFGFFSLSESDTRNYTVE